MQCILMTKFCLEEHTKSRKVSMSKLDEYIKMNRTETCAFNEKNRSFNER